MPIQTQQRHIILDALRGFALLGICLANYSEFSLYSFLDKSVTEAMPTSGIDEAVRYLQYIFIDGKFYTIFSILFGIGFSIILANRFFRVLGLFLLGFYIGKNKIYATLEDKKQVLNNVCSYGYLIGIPATLLYSFSAMNGHVWGLATHSILYTVSVLPLSLAFITSICLWYMRNQQNFLFRLFAVPGRMALTNYSMQSVFGMIIFYGIGFGLGASVGLAYVEMIAIGVFLIQVISSHYWLYKFQFGPLEWIWRFQEKPDQEIGNHRYRPAICRHGGDYAGTAICKQ